MTGSQQKFGGKRSKVLNKISKIKTEKPGIASRPGCAKITLLGNWPLSPGFALLKPRENLAPAGPELRVARGETTNVE